MSSHIRWRSLPWWLWTTIAVALWIGVGIGRPQALVMALALSTGQAAVWLLRHRDIGHFPTELRLAYLAWMLAGFVPGLGVLHWIQMLGTSALVTTGYCPLARLLLLLPWNRDVPLTRGRMATIFLHPPIHGSVRTGLPL